MTIILPSTFSHWNRCLDTFFTISNEACTKIWAKLYYFSRFYATRSTKTSNRSGNVLKFTFDSFWAILAQKQAWVIPKLKQAFQGTGMLIFLGLVRYTINRLQFRPLISDKLALMSSAKVDIQSSSVATKEKPVFYFQIKSRFQFSWSKLRCINKSCF